MNITDRVIEFLGGVTKAQADYHAHEAYASGYNDGNDDPASGDIGAGGFGYRSSTSGRGREGDIPWAENVATAWQQFQSNPLVKRDSDITRDYIIGSGFQYHSDNDDLQEINTQFVENNDLEDHAPKFARELFLFGAQCYPVFVKESTGAVTLGYIDPDALDGVVLHPDNPLVKVAVIVKAQTGANPWEHATDAKVYRIVRRNDAEKLATWEQSQIEPWEDEMLESKGLEEYSGSCLFFNANAMSNQGLGCSDYLQIADYADQWDETLFSLGDREQVGGYFVWDVKMIGASPEEVAEAANDRNKNTPPRRGGVLRHSDGEEWTPASPDLKQAGSIATVQEQRVNIIGGLGKPEAWFGRPSGTHLATAQAQGDPTFRSLEYKQGRIQKMLKLMFDLVRDQAIIAGMPGIAEDDTTKIVMPEMTARDMSVIITALSGLVSALMIIEDREWLEQDVILELLRKAIGELGVEVGMDDDNSGGETPDLRALKKALQVFNPRTQEPTDRVSARSYFEKHGVMGE